MIDSTILIDNTKVYNRENLSKNILSISNEILRKEKSISFETKLPKNLHMMDRASMMNLLSLDALSLITNYLTIFKIKSKKFYV